MSLASSCSISHILGNINAPLLARLHIIPSTALPRRGTGWRSSAQDDTRRKDRPIDGFLLLPMTQQHPRECDQDVRKGYCAGTLAVVEEFEGAESPEKCASRLTDFPYH